MANQFSKLESNTTEANDWGVLESREDILNGGNRLEDNRIGLESKDELPTGFDQRKRITSRSLLNRSHVLKDKTITTIGLESENASINKAFI